MKHTKRIGTLTVAVLGAVCAVIFAIPIASDLLFYDLWPYWAGAQILANAVFLVCLIRELIAAKGKLCFLYVGLMLPLFAFAIDVALIDLGLWKAGHASQSVFIVFFLAAA